VFRRRALPRDARDYWLFRGRVYSSEEVLTPEEVAALIRAKEERPRSDAA
jgi:hypothetical protein